MGGGGPGGELLVRVRARRPREPEYRFVIRPGGETRWRIDPYGRAAVAASIGVSGAARFGGGAAIAVFTGRSVSHSGGRQLLPCLLAAGVTFALGRGLA